MYRFQEHDAYDWSGQAGNVIGKVEDEDSFEAALQKVEDSIKFQTNQAGCCHKQ